MKDNGEQYYLGVDVGSISTNLAVINESRELIESVYIRTEGKPIRSRPAGSPSKLSQRMTGPGQC